MVDLLSVLHDPLRRFFHGVAPVTHIGGFVHQHAISGRTAERIDHRNPALRVLLAKHFGSRFCVGNRGRHARAKNDVQQVPLLKQLLEVFLILEDIDLRCGWNFPVCQELIEPRQCPGIPAHIVQILLSIHIADQCLQV